MLTTDTNTGPLCDPHELIELVRKGDVRALDRMTRCFGDRLVAVGRRYCRRAEDVDDAVQDALLSAGRHLQDFRGDGSIEGWLVRMVVNACHRMRRGRKNDPHIHDTETPLASAADSPEDLAGRGELMEVLGETLLKLPAKDRLIILLAEAEGWTGPQIAERLNMSPGAIRTRLSRARGRVRDELVERLGVEGLRRAGLSEIPA